MISIWFWYDFDMPKFMIFLWFWNLSVFLIWFWYDFLMVLESLRFLIWFWYDFLMVLESLRFFWYDFLMVLEYLRFLDMIFLWFWSASVFLIWFSYGFGVPPSFWYDFVIVFVRPHLPPPSPDPGHTSHARRRTHLPSRRQTVEPLRNSLISNFGFFLILLDLQARCSMLQTYRVQFEYKLYHFVGEAGKKKRFS